MGESGLELARRYYLEVVGPLLLADSPGLAHAGARLGSGSDVLGLDDGVSRDHDWGLRLTVLVDAHEVERVDALLERALPEYFAGWPTRFATSWDPVVRHRVEVDTPEGFATSRLGVASTVSLDPLDWLSLTGQALLEVTAGALYRDTHGAISDIRRRLAWYPDDLWRYVVAADWSRIAGQLPVVGRTGQRGDDTGSRVQIGHLARTIMHLGFLLERRWPPYPKWQGTAFARLPKVGRAAPALRAALTATTWQDRQSAAGDVLNHLHAVQRTMGLPTGSDAVRPFFDRPFLGVTDTVAELLTDSIEDPRVRALPAGVGSIEQWVDNVEVLTTPRLRLAAAAAWRSLVGGPVTDV